MALVLQQISPETAGFAAKSGVPLWRLFNQVFQLLSCLYFLYFITLSQFILQVSESMSPLSFLGTTNDCVSEHIWFPFGLDYMPDRAEASQGVKESEGRKNSDKSREFQTNPPASSPRQHMWVQQCFELETNGSLWEISFVVSSSPDSAWFGHYSQDLLLRMFAVLSECSCWEAFSFYPCIKIYIGGKVVENTADCSAIGPGSPRLLIFLEYLICHKPPPNLHS